jgi:2,3-bisphosphoglycerate-independent phosphoglycerate mutase
MTNGLKIIFIFVDGLGIGSNDPEINPLAGGRFPTLERMLGNAVPLDACLGVDGLPQSATGQATLLTGINAPKAMGRHIEGFPPPSLKKLIQHENLFTKLQKTGRRCTFANCYLNIDPHRIPPRRQSVTTVMTISALGRVRGTAELLVGKAVTHDITRRTMHPRVNDGPLITPEEAAGHLIATAE